MCWFWNRLAFFTLTIVLPISQSQAFAPFSSHCGSGYTKYLSDLNHVYKQQSPLPKSNVILHLAKKTSKKKKTGASSTVGIKGFGSGGSSVSTSSKPQKKAASYEIDRSKSSLDFYDYINKQGGGANLKRVALGHFPLGDTGMKIRGVVAMKPIPKGELILSIPYEMAINLGQEGDDPTIPAVTLLEVLCDTERDGYDDLAPYLTMLPKFRGRDCLGSTDFFSDKALSALQFPIIYEETVKRRKASQSRYQSEKEKLQKLQWKKEYNDENGAESSQTFPNVIVEEHLQYAVWLITSRVLTVQGQAGSNKSYRLMIPFIDMCNHDRSSPHILSGRAVPGGTLKIIAGRNVEAGEQINICYGGGVAGNDRFVQDYGFLDWADEGYDIVARQLLGRQRVIEGGGITPTQRDEVIEKLKYSSQKEDEELLARGGMQIDEVSAVQFRLGVKKSLEKYEQ